jgi:hypothetical protein
MIYLMFGLLLMLLWYLADKNLKKYFLSILKWPALLFAMYFIGFDLYYNVQFERIAHIDEDHANGLLYTHWDADLNTTVETRLFALQGADRGVVFAYFTAENELNSLFGGLLGPLLDLAILGLVIQVLYIFYQDYRGVTAGDEYERYGATKKDDVR